MADKWEDRTVEDIRAAASPVREGGTYGHGQSGHDDLAAAFCKTEEDGDNLFVGSDSLHGASSNESDDRKPVAGQGVKHSFDEMNLDTSIFDIDQPEPAFKRTKVLDQDDNVARMPILEGVARTDHIVRMPSHDHSGQERMAMSLNLPYQTATTPVSHHPNVHAAHNPYVNPSPGFTYLQDPNPHSSTPRQIHESPHRMMAYPSHHYAQQQMMHMPYYGHPSQQPRHDMGSPAEPQVRTRSARTSTGENSRESFRRGPSPEELDNAKTARARAALTTWYQRLEDLYKYKIEHGNCNVPQKYEGLPELGIWVNKQRMEKRAFDEGKKNSMSAQKINALNDLGFQWAKRKGLAAWNEKYEELVLYKQEHGDCQVPTKYPENPALGRWVSTQRSNYKEYERGNKTKMTEARKIALEDLGFKWTMMNN